MSKNKNLWNIRRVIAILVLSVIAALFILLLWLAFTGAGEREILAVLFMLMIVPAIFYVINWFAGVIKKR